MLRIVNKDLLPFKGAVPAADDDDDDDVDVDIEPEASKTRSDEAAVSASAASSDKRKGRKRPASNGTCAHFLTHIVPSHPDTENTAPVDDELSNPNGGEGGDSAAPKPKKARVTSLPFIDEDGNPRSTPQPDPSATPEADVEDFSSQLQDIPHSPTTPNGPVSTPGSNTADEQFQRIAILRDKRKADWLQKRKDAANPPANPPPESSNDDAGEQQSQPSVSEVTVEKPPRSNKEQPSGKKPPTPKKPLSGESSLATFACIL